MRRYLFISLLLGLLSACQVGPGRPPVMPEQTGVQVENWRGLEKYVSARVYGDEGAAVVATGTVSAAGMLTFALEPTPAAQLSPFVACPGVTVSDTALRLSTFSAFDVTQDDIQGEIRDEVQGETRTGQIAWASGLGVLRNGLQQIGDFYVQYTYTDRAATVSGRCQGGAPAVFSYVLTLQRGWNPVVFKLTKDGVLELSTEPVPAGAAWFFSEVNP